MLLRGNSRSISPIPATSASMDVFSPRSIDSYYLLPFWNLFLTYIFSSTRVVIPVNLFNCTAPSLTSLELKYCDISRKSSLLKGLRTLKIHGPSTEARPGLEDWLDALNGMPQRFSLKMPPHLHH